MRTPTVQGSPGGEPLLAVEDVIVRFGGIMALDGVSFTIEPGLIVGLIGPNGAGKTTLFNCLSRLYIPSAGDILFKGRSLLTVPANGIATLGIGRTFQNLALFRNLTVFDNIKIGGHSRTSTDLVSNGLRLPWTKREEEGLDATTWELINYLDFDLGRPQARRRPAVRHPKTRRARPGARHRAGASPPRRAGLRAQSRGGA